MDLEMPRSRGASERRPGWSGAWSPWRSAIPMSTSARSAVGLLLALLLGAATTACASPGSPDTSTLDENLRVARVEVQGPG